MANQGPMYGVDKELAAKRAAKYDPELEAQARDWIQQVTGETVGTGPDGFCESLKSGVILCNLINKIKPGAVKKVNNSKIAFMQIENVGNYTKACQQLGVNPSDLFDPPVLIEGKDPGAVVRNIHSLGRTAQKIGFSGPQLGVKESQGQKTGHVVTATGSSVASKQTQGSHGHANASGMHDKSRNIVKDVGMSSNEVTFVSQGSVGYANQSGMHDTSRNIVKGPQN